MNRSEELLQKAILSHVGTTGMERAVPCFVFSVINQRGTRKRWEQAFLTAMGMRAGVSDLLVLVPEGRIIAVELKASATATGMRPLLQKSQEEFARRCLDLGVPHLTICDLMEWDAFSRELRRTQPDLSKWASRLRSRGPTRTTESRSSRRAPRS